MKRLFFTLSLLLCVLVVAQAQVGVMRTSSYGAIKKEKKPKKERPQRTYEWTNTILANYALSLKGPSHNIGLTYARCKLAGFYTSAMVGTEWNFATVEGAPDDYFLTNKTSHPRISVTAGPMVRLVIPLYIYAGIGYAYRPTNYQTIDNQWVNARYASPVHGGNAEGGLMGNIFGFTLQAGYSIIFDGHSLLVHELKFGVGYTF
ncbi:MAG: hypothetical protein IJS82_03950 [Paludibacteraceae bacterium]|nr:hypothetical protein [Paludibacteraceae bacterium]